MARLANKVAVITGAASGIGMACVQRFFEEGAQVVGLDIGQPSAELLASFTGQAREPVFMELDVRDEACIAERMNQIAERFERIDVLVNAAGIAGQGRVSDISSADWQLMLDINLTGSMLTCKYALDVMQKQQGGSIINIGSIFGLQGCDGNIAYNVAKGGINQLTRSLAIDYGLQNIRVNGICPGLIETPMSAAVQLHGEIYRRFVAQHMLNRPGQPVEVANMALFLASDEASFVSGQMIAVDGGLSAGRRVATLLD